MTWEEFVAGVSDPHNIVKPAKKTEWNPLDLMSPAARAEFIAAITEKPPRSSDSIFSPPEPLK